MKIPIGSPGFRALNPHLGIAPKVEPTYPVEPDLTLRPCTDEQKLNKTEKAYLLHLRCILPRDAYIGIQNITLKLGDDCRFTPDFSYINENGRMTFVDIKGFQREDALVKIKAASRMFRWARFVIVTKEKTGWNEREIRT